MASERKIELQFPMAGLDRRNSIQRQPPFTTPGAVNVRPDESIEQRARGGSRPGLGQPFTGLTVNSPVRMLSQIRSVKSSPKVTWTDGFDSPPLSAVWNGITGYTIPSITISGGNGLCYAPLNSPTRYGAVRAAMPDIDASLQYEITLRLYWTPGVKGTWAIFARVASPSPGPNSDGLKLSFRGNADGTNQTSIITLVSSVAVDIINGSSSPLNPGFNTMKLIVNGNSVSAEFNGSSIISPTVVTGPAGSFWGFGLVQLGTSTGTIYTRVLSDYISINYSQDIPQKDEILQQFVVAVSSGVTYSADESDKSFTVVTDSNNTGLNSDEHLQAIDHLQNLYIADYGKVFSGSNGTTDAAGTTFDSATYSDWTNIGGESITKGFVLVVEPGGGGTQGVYEITGVTASNFTIVSSAGSSASGIVFRVERVGKVVNTKLNTISNWKATTGTVPVGCPLICRYNDRLVLAGEPRNPHLWYTSRQGDPLDWDYGADPFDVGKAYAGTFSQQSGATQIGEPITALIPTDDVLIFGCASSLWAMVGDPAQGGAVINRSLQIGVVGRQAWCHGPSGEVIFLSHDGVYIIQTPMSYPVSISRQRLPDNLRDINETNRIVTMAYDIRDRGIHIYATDPNSAGVSHWWLSWENRGFWGVTLNADHEPYSILSYDPSVATESRVLLGCRDGKVRSYDHGNPDDDGTAFTSYVFIGAIRPAGAERTGMIRELVGTLAQGSRDLTWSIHSGQTAEEAFGASAVASGTWSAGLNSRARPRRRGDFLYVKLSGTTAPWALEEATATLEALGVQRVA